MNKKIFVGVSVWMIVLFFYPTLLLAQNEAYSGGFGSGDNNISSNLISCNNNRFAGGNGEGSNNIFSSLTNCNALRFGGGNGKGDSSIATSLLNCNTFRFSGDSADGIDFIKTNLLNCNSVRFAGDSGSGYKSALFIKPRSFLGNDTAITIICTEERFNLLSLYNFNGINIAWNTVKPDSAAVGNYRAIGTTVGGCVDTAFALIKQEIAIWNGSASNDWHTAANWNSNRVPNEITHVIIPGGTANSCVIQNADAKAASVQGKINGNFSIINNKNLLISGHCVQLPAGL